MGVACRDRFATLLPREAPESPLTSPQSIKKGNLLMLNALVSALRGHSRKSSAIHIGAKASKPGSIEIGTTSDNQRVTIALPAIIYASGVSGTGLHSGVMLGVAEQLIQQDYGLLYLDAHDPQCGTFTDLCLMAHAARRRVEPQASTHQRAHQLLQGAAHGAIVWHNMHGLRRPRGRIQNASVKLFHALAEAVPATVSQTTRPIAVLVGGLNAMLMEQQTAFAEFVQAATASGITIVAQSDRCLQPELWHSATCWVLTQPSPWDSLCFDLASASPFRPGASQLLPTLAPGEALVSSPIGDTRGDHIVQLRLPDVVNQRSARAW